MPPGSHLFFELVFLFISACLSVVFTLSVKAKFKMRRITLSTAGMDDNHLYLVTIKFCKGFMRGTTSNKGAAKNTIRSRSAPHCVHAYEDQLKYQGWDS